MQLIDEKSIKNQKYPAPIYLSGECDLYACALSLLSWINPLRASSVSFSRWKFGDG